MQQTSLDMMKEVLEKRLDQLGWSQYKLTKEICAIRAMEGEEDPKVTRYQSSIRKAIADPDHVNYYIIEDIVKALGGEIVIRWKTYEEEVVA